MFRPTLGLGLISTNHADSRVQSRHVSPHTRGSKEASLLPLLTRALLRSAIHADVAALAGAQA